MGFVCIFLSFQLASWDCFLEDLSTSLRQIAFVLAEC